MTKTTALMKASALCGLFLMTLAPSARADVMYNYSGVDFTNFTGTDSGSTQTDITASLKFASLLPDSASGTFSPEAWQISDGSFTLTNLSPNVVETSFSISTDSNGNIIGWDVTARQTNNTPGFNLLVTESGVDFTDYCGGTDVDNCAPQFGSAYVYYPIDPDQATTTQAQPSWTSETVGAAAPEPGTIWMFAGALLMLSAGLYLRRRRTNQAKS